MKNISLSLLLPLLLGSLAGLARADVQVTPFRIEETRSLDFGDDKISRQPPSLQLTLSLRGPEAEACTQYGHLKLDEAADDHGQSLIPTNDIFQHAEEFKQYANAFFRNSRFGNEQPAAPQVEIELAPSSRAATKIIHLRGSFELADAGTIQTVEAQHLKTTAGKKIPMPAGAPFSLTLGAVGSDDARSIAVVITGDESALESIEVVDASGQTVSQGLSSWSMNGGPVNKSLSLSRPLDDSMKLVAKVCLNRKIVKVPFDLQNITLP